MATQMHEIAWPPGLLEREREKKKTKSCVFRLFFYVYTHVDNRERARASD